MYFASNPKSYKVGGIIANHMSSKVDNSLYIIWDECDEATRALIKESLVDYLHSGFANAIYESDIDIDNAFDESTQAFETIGLYDMGPNTLYSGNYQNYWYKSYPKEESVQARQRLKERIILCFSLAMA